MRTKDFYLRVVFAKLQFTPFLDRQLFDTYIYIFIKYVYISWNKVRLKKNIIL